MPFQYKTVLLVGATSGIGAALADKFVAEGSKVIAVGRRQDKLDEFTRRHGIDRAAAIRFDITDWANMDGFVQR
jgi:NADP-dependent 3-hydroxy acid dehydrogenase YdfG